MPFNSHAFLYFIHNFFIIVSSFSVNFAQALINLNITHSSHKTQFLLLIISSLSLLSHTKTPNKGCVKKHLLLYFLNNFLIFKYFFTKSHRDMPYYIRKRHVKFESIIIIKSEEILVLMELT